jgi:hypothetical protein
MQVAARRTAMAFVRIAVEASASRARQLRSVNRNTMMDAAMSAQAGMRRQTRKAPTPDKALRSSRRPEG